MYQITRQRRFNKAGFVIIGLFLLLLVGFFYGCQLLQPKTVPQELSDQMPLYRRVGILKSLGGVRTSDSGTHLLEMDDGSTILLKSLQINLDDVSYLNKTVEVRGILTYTTDKKQIMEVANIDLVNDEDMSVSREARWQEMKNDELGLAINYRDDLQVDYNDGVLVFSRKIEPNNQVTSSIKQLDDHGSTQTSVPQQSQFSESASVTQSDALLPKIIHRLTISKTILLGDETIYNVAGLKNGETDLLSSGITKSKIGLGSYDALKKVYGDTTSYYLQSGNSVYTVIIDAGNDEQSLQDQNLFYTMLNSLKLSSDAVSLTKESKTPDLSQANPDATVKASDEGGLASSLDTEDTKTSSAKTILPADNVSITTSSGVSVTSNDNQAKPDLDVKGLSQTMQTEEMSLDGYEKLESESFKFAMLYPKSWYYSGSAGNGSGVIRHYEFGSKPLEEVPGDVSMDLTSGTIPSGNVTIVNGKELTVISDTNGVEVYVKGSGSRVYRLTGPASKKNVLMNMASSITD